MKNKKLLQNVSIASPLYSYLLLFFLSSYLGWVWEVLVCWVAHGFSSSLLNLILYYRGVLHGPWAPIYGLGVILLTSLWQFFRGNKVSVLLSSTFACGLLEYVSGWLLETFFHRKWWDYSSAFLNLHGRICFVSVFGFGILGGIAILFLLPLYLRWINRISPPFRKGVCTILSSLFLLDVTISITQLLRAVL